MIGREQLLRLMAENESHRVEKTASGTKTDKFCEAICAFSNDLSGSQENGYLLIGVNDSGLIAGLKVDDRLLLTVSNIRTDGNILPQPIMQVEKFSFTGGDVLVVEVQPATYPPVRYRGRVWVRIGPRKSLASEAEEKMLIERRLSNAQTFDALPQLGASLADLDLPLIRRDFLPNAVAADVLAEDKRPIEEQLASLGLFDLRHACPTNAAIVLFARKPSRFLPGAYIQYVRYAGLDRGDNVINEQRFMGALARELPVLDAFVRTSIAMKRPKPVSALREEPVSKYPHWATRELLMNALMHRDYQSNAPVLFNEFDDRLEIQNPGGLYGQVTWENFPNVSDYRNPNIAEAMKVLGYVNRFSRGVDRVNRELEENGNGRADFDTTLLTAFRALEHASRWYVEPGFSEGGAERDDGYVGQAVESVLSDNSASDYAINPVLSDNSASVCAGSSVLSDNSAPDCAGSSVLSDNSASACAINPPALPDSPLPERILEALSASPELSARRLGEILQVKEYTIRYNLGKLVKAGRIRREGSRKTGRWLLVPPFD